MRKIDRLDRAENLLTKIKILTEEWQGYEKKPAQWLSEERHINFQNARLRAVARYKKIYNLILEQSKF